MRARVRKELGDSAVMVTGHPHEESNGVYKHDSEYNGWPVLKNAHGRYYHIKAARLYGLHPATAHELSETKKKYPSHAWPIAYEPLGLRKVFGTRRWLVIDRPKSRTRYYTLTLALVPK